MRKSNTIVDSQAENVIEIVGIDVVEPKSGATKTRIKKTVINLLVLWHIPSQKTVLSFKLSGILTAELEMVPFLSLRTRLTYV